MGRSRTVATAAKSFVRNDLIGKETSRFGRRTPLGRVLQTQGSNVAEFDGGLLRQARGADVLRTVHAGLHRHPAC